MRIAPTEPKELRALGHVGTRGEDLFGVDVFWVALKLKYGIQRKRVDDLIKSIQSGHLAEQIARMHGLDVPVLLIEGRLNWSVDGELMLPWGRFSKRALRGFLWSVQHEGIWVEWSSGIQETVEVVRGLEAWSRKPRHSSVRGREPIRDLWGSPGNPHFQAHILSGFPGVGAELAARIVAVFGGAPLGWRCTREELAGVKGMGKKKVDRVFDALGEQFATAG